MKRLLLLAAISAAIIIIGGSAPAAASTDQRAVIVDLARQQIGDRYRMGANGPDRFDCSGLVWYVFQEAGLGERVGDGRKLRAYEYWKWMKDRGALTTDPDLAQPGDLVFFALFSRVSHVGIYTGRNSRGKPKAVSALVPYVDETKLTTLTTTFVAFGHVDLVIVPDPTPSPTIAPTPSPPAVEPTEAPTPEPSANT